MQKFYLLFLLSLLLLFTPDHSFSMDEGNIESARILRKLPPKEAKYLVVEIENLGSKTLTFDMNVMSGGEEYDVPEYGSEIGSVTTGKNKARLVFKQMQSSTFRGPEANILIAGKNGKFELYVQQNFALLKSGEITAHGKYIEYLKKATDINNLNEVTDANISYTIKRGGYSSCYGYVSFLLNEDKKE